MEERERERLHGSLILPWGDDGFFSQHLWYSLAKLAVNCAMLITISSILRYVHNNPIYLPTWPLESAEALSPRCLACVASCMMQRTKSLLHVVPIRWQEWWITFMAIYVPAFTKTCGVMFPSLPIGAGAEKYLPWLWPRMSSDCTLSH